MTVGLLTVVGCRSLLIFLLAACLHRYKAFDRERFTSEYPDLEAYIQRIAALPAVSDYIRTKQEPTTWFGYRFPHIVGPLGHRLTTPEELEGLTELAPKL